MRVLALDTALGATAVAVVDFPAGTIIAADRQLMERGHAEALLPMVRAVMDKVPGGFSALDRIVTTVGPGSFTGLRVALSAARSFALALEKPVTGVSCLTAYAAPLIAAGTRTVIASAIDARHGSVFFESYWLDGKRARGPEVMTAEAAARSLRGGRSRVIGNGAHLVAAAAQAEGIEAEALESPPAPDILWIARLGAAADPAFAPARPLYLKAASAVPQAGVRIPRVTS